MARFVVHEVPVDGPCTHALVIGVGKYPHLIGGEAPCQNPDGMGQLSSPPISARELAVWFMTDYHDPDKDLASVALLLSEANPQPFVNPKTNQPHDIEEAIGNNVEAAITDWYDRADSHQENRLFFYFCGHGVSQGEDFALLTSDFCSDEHNPLKGAIDFRLLVSGLKKCRASQQVFFVDACRANSDALIGESNGFAGRVPLLSGHRPKDLPDRLHVPYYATLGGDRAYAREGSVSLFTEALLKSLRGAASDNPKEEEWLVTTGKLQEAIDHFMKQPIFAGEIAGVQVPVAGNLPVFALHHLTREPEVPVYVGCEPSDDNQLAEFVCLFGGQEKARRTLAEVDPADPKREWSLNLTHGDYVFRAEFGAGGPPRSSKSIPVRPTYKQVTLKAGQ